MKLKALILIFALISVFSHIFPNIPKTDDPPYRISSFFSLPWIETSNRHNINEYYQAFIVSNKTITVTVIKFNPEKFASLPLIDDPSLMTFITAAHYFNKGRPTGYYALKKDGRNYFIKNLRDLGSDICSFELTNREEKIKKIKMISSKLPGDIETGKVDISIFPHPRKVKYVQDGKYYNLIGEAVTHTKEHGFLIEKEVTEWDCGKSFIGQNGEIYIITKASLGITLKDKTTKSIAFCPKVDLSIKNMGEKKFK